MNRGELVPDDLTIEMIKARLQRDDCKVGALLDGFPRTPAQAVALGNMLAEWNGKVECVPYISVPAEELIGRLSGRWTCRAQGHVYHEKFNPSKAQGICDVDGSELYQRDDDKAATVERRIHVYLEQTTPLIDYYTKQGVLAEVDGTLPIDQVTTQLLKAIKKEQ